MASKEHKIVRRAQAMSKLGFLSRLLAEQLQVEVPDVNATNRDPELAEIQRIENINGLLTKLLEAGKTEVETESQSVKKSTKKHAAVER